MTVSSNAATNVTQLSHGVPTASGFEAVEDAFRQIQQRDRELGSAVCIYLQGRPVVDLWAGYTSPRRNTAWQQDTVVSIFSITKALTALCLLHLVDRGNASLDDVVVAHWPEFAKVDAARKSRVTLRHLLTHTAGLPSARINRPGDVYDWRRMVSALENAPLLWPAESHTAYHAVTFGHLVGELVRRISGRMPSAYFAENFAEPLGLDLSIRLMPDQVARLAWCDGDGWRARVERAKLTYVGPRSRDWRAQYFRPCGMDYHPNSRRWREAEAPALTGFGTARGLARLAAMLSGRGVLDDERVFSENLVDVITCGRPAPGHDLGHGVKVRIGLGLYFNLSPMAELGPNPNSFGHTGMGGTTMFADPDNDVGFGYVCNHLHKPNVDGSSILGDRASTLANAFYNCLRCVSGG